MTGPISLQQLERLSELLASVPNHSARSTTKYRPFESYLANVLRTAEDSIYTAYVSKAGNASVRFDQSSKPRHAKLLIAVVEPPKNEHPMRTIEALERYCAEKRPDAEFLCILASSENSWRPYAAIFVANDDPPLLMPFIEGVSGLRVFPQTPMLAASDPEPSAATLQFIVMPKDLRPTRVAYPYVALVPDDWSDPVDPPGVPYQTMFSMYFRPNRQENEFIGEVKLLREGQSGGQTVLPPRPFEKLDSSYCSLGQSYGYYETLRTLPDVIRKKILGGLRDTVYNEDIRQKFEREPGFRESLARTGKAERALQDAVALFADDGGRARGGLSFAFSTNVGGGPFQVDFSFSQRPDLPGRINAVIGYNGTGKTRLLAHIALIATADRRQREEFEPRYGRIVGNAPFRFSSVIAVSYSAFDTFVLPSSFWQSVEERRHAAIRLRQKGEVGGYAYCGLRRPDVDEPSREPRELKSIDELAEEFQLAFDQARSHEKRRLLHEAISIIFQEPSFGRMGLGSSLAGDGVLEWINENFGSLSTGHKIAVNILVQVIAHSEPLSLVLIDEPESHLHPSLLAALVRALNVVLDGVDSYAVVATHSPVVLQEIPRRYVRILQRFGDTTGVASPSIETFGENVGYLTSNVFHLDSTETDYHAVLKQLATTRTLDEIEELFDDEMSAQARAYVLGFLRAEGRL